MRAYVPAVAAVIVTLAALADSRVVAQPSASVRGLATIAIPVSARRPTSAYPSRVVTSAVLAPASELRNVVVFLADAPTRPVTATHVEIRQRDEQFLPRVVAVPVGSEVSFPNDDPFYHNVFSLGRVRSFNLGRFPKGQSRAVRFNRPGTVKVFCDIHSHMTATVMVFNHPWFAVPDDEGRFEIPDVPPGEQRITAWHERLGDTTLTTRVEPGRAVSIEFVLPVPR